MRKVTVLASLLLLAPAVSQAKTLDELLVEKGVITKAEAQSASGGAASKTYWKDGTRFDFPDVGFTSKVNTLIMTRYTFTDNDEEASAENTSSFDVEKARIIISGSAVHEEFNYYLAGDFVGASDSDGTKTADLRDAWLQWNACDWASLRMGQYKTQLSRQFNNADHALQFADRSGASDFFSLGRAQGLTGYVKSSDGAWAASAGIFNGISDGEGINSGGVDTEHTGIVSVRWNPMGQMNAFEEGDVDWTEDAAVSLGATYAASSGTQASAGGDVDQHNIAVDVNFKWNGWSAHGEYFIENYEPDAAGSDDVEPQGFYAQIGYFLDPKTWEIAGRYGLIDCDDGAVTRGICSGNDKVNEVTVGLNYFWWRHSLKAQLNFVHLNERVLGDGDDINTNKWIFQLSSFF